MAGENLEYDLSLSEQFTHRPPSSDTEALPSHPHQQQHHHHHSKPNVNHTSSNSALTQQQPPHNHHALPQQQQQQLPHNHHALPQQQQQPPHNHHALPLTFPATSTSVLPQRHQQQQQQHPLPLPPSLPHHHASRHSLEAAGQMVSFDEKMKNWFDRDSAIGNSVESREVESTELDTDDEAEELR